MYQPINETSVINPDKLDKNNNSINDREQFLANAIHHPEAIKGLENVTNVIATALNVSPKEISQSERFEIQILKYIQTLAPNELTFLKSPINLADQASYDSQGRRIAFRFNQYGKDQHKAMADILNRCFSSNIDAEVADQTHAYRGSTGYANNGFWITMNKNAFLSEVFPRAFQEYLPDSLALKDQIKPNPIKISDNVSKNNEDSKKDPFTDMIVIASPKFDAGFNSLLVERKTWMLSKRDLKEKSQKTKEQQEDQNEQQNTANPQKRFKI